MVETEDDSRPFGVSVHLVADVVPLSDEPSVEVTGEHVIPVVGPCQFFCDVFAKLESRPSLSVIIGMTPLFKYVTAVEFRIILVTASSFSDWRHSIQIRRMATLRFDMYCSICETRSP